MSLYRELLLTSTKSLSKIIFFLTSSLNLGAVNEWMTPKEKAEGKTWPWKEFIGIGLDMDLIFSTAFWPGPKPLYVSDWWPCFTVLLYASAQCWEGSKQSKFTLKKKIRNVLMPLAKPLITCPYGQLLWASLWLFSFSLIHQRLLCIWFLTGNSIRLLSSNAPNGHYIENAGTKKSIKWRQVLPGWWRMSKLMQVICSRMHQSVTSVGKCLEIG